MIVEVEEDASDALPLSELSPEQRAQRETKTAEKHAKKPWRGQDAEWGSTVKQYMREFDDDAVLESYLEAGQFAAKRVKTKTSCKHCGKSWTESFKRINPGKKLEHLLDPRCSVSDTNRLAVANLSNGQKAKRVREELVKKGNETATPEVTNLEAASKAKVAKSGKGSRAKELFKQEEINKHITVDKDMPAALLTIALKAMAVFFFVCRVPFSVVDNFFFRQFLRCIRPSFEKQLGARYQDTLRTKALKEVYDDTKDIVEDALNVRPGACNDYVMVHSLYTNNAFTKYYCNNIELNVLRIITIILLLEYTNTSVIT
jgi:hypothetical protein